MAHFLALSAALAIGWLQKRVLASALRVGIAFFAYCVVNAVASEQGDAVSNVVMNLSKIGWLLCAGMCAYHAYWLEFAAACVFSSLTLSGTFRPWKPTNYLTTIAHTLILAHLMDCYSALARSDFALEDSDFANAY
tara:strand:- start:169 stop:576 length:408 start_codon:yes stop_codon:yes gene_type:complete